MASGEAPSAVGAGERPASDSFKPLLVQLAGGVLAGEFLLHSGLVLFDRERDASRGRDPHHGGGRLLALCVHTLELLLQCRVLLNLLPEVANGLCGHGSPSETSDNSSSPLQSAFLPPV